MVPRRDRSTTAALQIHQRLRYSIISGAYLPFRVLSEKDLAAQFGVSRTPVREALGKLEDEGLVSIRPQSGTLVTPICINRIRSGQFVREALECAAIGLAAARCTPGDAARLRDMLEQQRSCSSDAEFLLADEQMHRHLMTLSGQTAAWELAEAARLHLDRIRHLSVQQPSKRTAVLSEHAEIVARVAINDGAGAVEAMRQHLRGVFASTEETMRRVPEFFETAAGEGPPPRRRLPRGGPTPVASPPLG